MFHTSFLIVLEESSCGVVIIIAPSGLDCFKEEIEDKCSSEVPGGVSIIRYSNGPQKVSFNNFLIKLVFLGPRQIIGASKYF